MFPNNAVPVIPVVPKLEFNSISPIGFIAIDAPKPARPKFISIPPETILSVHSIPILPRVAEVFLA